MAEPVGAAGGANGLSPSEDAEIAEAIGLMFGLPMLLEQKKEDAEMFPEEGVS